MRRILVLYWHPKGTEMRLSIQQHLHLLDDRGARILYHNAIEPAPPWIAWTAPDLCILHTTFLCVRWFHDFEAYRRRFGWISKLSCPKVALPQDEYDHAAVLDEWLLKLGVTSVFSCFGPDQRPSLYPTLEQRVPFHETLTGFIDESAATAFASRMVPHSQRPTDIVYRARNLPYWFGSYGQLKHEIGEAVLERAPAFGLSTNISTRPEDTIYGDRWLEFLMSGRAVIGTESGSSVLDARGEIQRRISRLLSEQPSLTFEQVDAQMPPGWDSCAFFAISPRHLEAVITKTAQILVEGSYSGLLVPERHYIPLFRDFSNLDEALERLHDGEAVEAMAERAYQDVYLEGHNTLRDFADQLLEQAGSRRTRVAVPLALAKRVSVPVRSPVAGKRLQQLIPHVLTLLDALARQPEARKLVLTALRRRLPLRNVLKEIVLLRVLARIQGDAGSGGAWSLSVESTAGTILIRTELGHVNGREPRLEEPFESLIWNHSAVAQAAPVFPRRPMWGWVSLGVHGRYEFTTVAELARTDADAARALLERALAA